MNTKRLIREVLPRPLAEILAIVLRHTYAEDGLMSQHVADFLCDPRFVRAYAKGASTGSWNGSAPRFRTYIACWAASHAAILRGDFVECGVNRGGMSLAVMEYLSFNAFDKKFFLLDTYCGFTEGSIHGNEGQYQECYEDVLRIFAPYPRAVVIKGPIPETLTQITSEHIAYASIDMNCAEPEIAAFRFLWPRMVSGAVVLLDDYAFGPPYRRQKDAFDALSEEMQFSILTLPTGQGLIVKV